MSYRATPPPPSLPPSSTVEYFPRSRGSALAILALMLVVSGLVVVFGIRSARGVTLGCTRTSSNGGTCTIETRYPIGLHSTELLLLSSIRGSRVDRTSTKNGWTYRFIITTIDRGDVEAGSSLGASAFDLRESFERFRFDARIPTFQAVILREQPILVFIVVGIGLLPLLIGLLVFQRARLVFQWRDRRLELTRFRWPLWPSRQSISIGSLASASTRVEEGRRRQLIMIDLEMKDGTKIQVSGLSAASFERAHDVVAQINALLAERAGRSA